MGCVAVDASGNVAAGASSGGLILKTPGRVGQSAVFGAGCWAENNCSGKLSVLLILLEKLLTSRACYLLVRILWLRNSNGL